MRHIQILFLLILGFSSLNAQSLIGLDKNQVKSKMKEIHPDMIQDNSFRNPHFDYYKYQDVSGLKTFLIFFNEEGNCKSTKLICDYALYSEVVDSLTNNFRKVSATNWELKERWSNFSIELKKEDWFFTVKTIEK